MTRRRRTAMLAAESMLPVLMRRAALGGRKGRRALRRLRAWALRTKLLGEIVRPSTSTGQHVWTFIGSITAVEASK